LIFKNPITDFGIFRSSIKFENYNNGTYNIICKKKILMILFLKTYYNVWDKNIEKSSSMWAVEYHSLLDKKVSNLVDSIDRIITPVERISVDVTLCLK